MFEQLIAQLLLQSSTEKQAAPNGSEHSRLLNMNIIQPHHELDIGELAFFLGTRRRELSGDKLVPVRAPVPMVPILKVQIPVAGPSSVNAPVNVAAASKQ